jgi:hypothetical protein
MSAFEIHSATKLVVRQKERAEDVEHPLEIILTEGYNGEAVTFAVHVRPIREQITPRPFNVGNALELLGFEFYEDCQVAKPICYSLILAHLEHGKLHQESEIDLRNRQFGLIVKGLPSLLRSLLEIARRADECGLRFGSGI